VSTIANKVGVAERTVRDNISKLADAGIIEMGGNKRNRIWRVLT
jgi:DNA-binding Lrp family transcriptional regulator